MSNSFTTSLPGKLSQVVTVRGAYRTVAFVYFMMGTWCLWFFLTTLVPLGESRIEFEIMRANDEQLAPVRDQLRPLLAKDGKSVADPKLSAIIKTLDDAGVPAEFLKQLLTTETEYEKYEAIARKEFETASPAETQVEIKSTPTSISPDTKEKGDTNVGVKAPDSTKLGSDGATGVSAGRTSVVKRMPPSNVFKVYLSEKHEALYDSAFVKEWARLESWNLMLRAFIGLALGAGLLGGCIRLFGFGRAKNTANRAQDLIWPLATPVLAVFVVMLLTGFGRIFKSDIDSATSKFLMVLVGAIAISPEVFLIAIRRYVFDLLMEFKPETRNEEKVPGSDEEKK